jgi:hypothetical protein
VRLVAFGGRARLAMLGFVGVVALTWYRGYVGDYQQEVAPALNALAGGNLWRAIHHQANIGPFSLFLRAPMVAAAHSLGAGQLVSYRVGAVPCVAAAAILGVALLRAFGADADSWPRKLLVVLLAVATPAAMEALDLGHPEEILGAALSVGAVVACIRRKHMWAALLLGCAIATKQWALLAIGPAMLACGRPHWWRVPAAACGIAAVFLSPLVFADHQTFAAATRAAASAPTEPLYQSWWYLFAHNLPGWIAQKTKPLIVLSAIPLTLFAYLRRGGARSALPLLALLFLIRCVFDPQTNYYYHLPFLLALLAWDVQARRPLPYSALAATAALFVTNSYLEPDAGLYAGSVFYFIWTLSLAAYLLFAIARPSGRAIATRPQQGFGITPLKLL